MSINVILHISGEEAVQGEVDELPSLADTLIKVNNPHRIDGKDVHYLTETVTIVYWPVHRLNFIEVLPSKEQEAIIGFVRE
jgi:hypothetical protein